jgi:hypothetical protein
MREITLRTKEINKTILICIHYVYRSGGGGGGVGRLEESGDFEGIPILNGNEGE